METNSMKGLTVTLALAALVAIAWLSWGFAVGEAPLPALAPDLQTHETAAQPAATTLSEQEPRRAVETTLATTADHGSGLLIRLVRGDTGEVMPDHDLWFATRFMGGSSDPEQAFAKQAKKLRTDSRGIARIAEPTDWMSFFAREEHLVGYLELRREQHLDSGDAFATLELFPERGLLLRVIDRNSKPVQGISLQILMLQEGKAQSKHWKWLPATDENGSIAWQGFGIFLRNVEKKDATPGVGLRIKAKIPGDDNIVRDISPLPVDGQRIDLQLPPTGTLTVRFLDPDGALVPGQRSAVLRHLDPNSETGEWKKGPSHYQSLRDGIAAFPAVTLNDYFDLTIQGSSSPLPQAEVFGPTTDELSVTHELSFDDDHVRWRGRAVDEAGRGISTRKLRGEINIGKKWYRDYSGTDSDGRFLFIFSPQVAAAALTSAKIRFAGYAPVDLVPQGPFHPGTLELGDLVFAAQVTLLAGEVVIPAAAACKQYQLAVERRAPGSEDWQKVNTKTQIEKLEFTILGMVETGEYRLKVMNAWTRCFMPPEPIMFTPGQEGLEIRVDAGHRLTVHARVPGSPKNTWYTPFYLKLRPTSETAAELLASTKQMGMNPHGQKWRAKGQYDFNWHGLPTGTYELEIWLTGETSPLRTIPDIQIPNPDGDPASIDLDLGEDLTEFHLHLRTPSGEAPEKTVTAIYLKGNAILQKNAQSQKGANELVMIAPPGFYGLWILAPGYQPVLIHQIDRDQDVILTSSDIELVIRLGQAIELPDGVSLQAHIESHTEIPAGWQVPPARAQQSTPTRRAKIPSAYLKRNWPRTALATLNSEGKATLTLHRTGAQTIRIGLVPTTTERRANWPKEKVWIDGVTPARFDIEATGGTQSLQISIPPTALQAALQKAGVR